MVRTPRLDSKSPCGDAELSPSSLSFECPLPLSWRVLQAPAANFPFPPSLPVSASAKPRIMHMHRTAGKSRVAVICCCSMLHNRPTSAMVKLVRSARRLGRGLLWAVHVGTCVSQPKWRSALPYGRYTRAQEGFEMLAHTPVTKPTLEDYLKQLTNENSKVARRSNRNLQGFKPCFSLCWLECGFGLHRGHRGQARQRPNTRFLACYSAFTAYWRQHGASRCLWRCVRCILRFRPPAWVVLVPERLSQ